MWKEMSRWIVHLHPRKTLLENGRVT
jgi:hypothetical protein